MVTEASSFQFFATNLPAATTFRAKLFAQNSKGRSDAVMLNVQTLRPAERLVDSHTTNGQNNLQARSQIFTVQPTLIIFVAGAAIAVLVSIVIIVAIVRSRRRIVSTTARPGVTSAVAPRPSDRAASEHLPLNGSGGGATLFGDEHEDGCCCDDDCCDEMLLMTNHADPRSQFSQVDCRNPNSKGPDIIPSFGYCTSTSGEPAGLENPVKQYMPYGKRD